MKNGQKVKNMFKDQCDYLDTRVYAKDLIIIIIIIIMDLFLERPAEPMCDSLDSGQAPRGREPQHMASGKAWQGEDKGIVRC